MFGQKPKKTETNHRIPTQPDAAGEPLTPAEEGMSPTTACLDSENVICKGTIINGNIIAEGVLAIDGTVRGDVETKSTLFLGPTGVIEGNIIAANAEVAGQIKGTVKTSGLLVIKSSSVIDGDVFTKNLNVESGSTFNGKFSVGSVTSKPLPKKSESVVNPAPAFLGEPVRPSAPILNAVPSKV